MNSSSKARDGSQSGDLSIKDSWFGLFGAAPEVKACQPASLTLIQLIMSPQQT